MSTAQSLLIVGLIVLGVLGLFGVVFFHLFTAMQNPLDVRSRFEHPTTDEWMLNGVLMEDRNANCFGLESAGRWQVRGNGRLALTATDLRFCMSYSGKEIRVPLETITELAITTSHLGKITPFNDLLKVHFVANGERDSVAWYLTDPHAWMRRIMALKAGDSPR